MTLRMDAYLVRAGIAVAVLVALGWLGGCSDVPGGPACCDPPRDPPPQGLVVSDLAQQPGVAAAASALLTLTSSADDSVAYGPDLDKVYTDSE